MTYLGGRMFRHILLVSFTASLPAVSLSQSKIQRVGNNNDIGLLNQEQRRLQSLFSYSPIDTISDQAAIDLDQREIENELIKAADDDEDNSSILNALRIYSSGAHSKSYARIELDFGLTYTTPAGAPVIGRNMAGEEISGATLLNDAEAGSTVVEVLYPITTDSESGIGGRTDCQVGASMAPLFDGCFSVQGELVVGNNAPITYSYDMSFDNHNDRSIRQFSLNAETEIFRCDIGAGGLPQSNNCPYKELLQFYNYYGEFDYGDEWITSALRAGDTSFDSDLGNAQFSLFGDTGRVVAAGSGTVYMNVWMYVVGKMSNAIHDCHQYCSDSSSPTCSDANKQRMALSWDEAVAFYIGSLQQDNPSDGGLANMFGRSNGYLLYQLANDRCMEFHTCGQSGNDGAGHAKVNYEILDLFLKGQEQIFAGDCDAVNQNKEQIVSYMLVPLIQGLLRSAFIISELSVRTEEEEAKGATYAAAILPLLHSCSAEDADIVYENMKVVGRRSNESIPLPHFTGVKHALARNYHCLGLSCLDVGGLVESNPTYLGNGAPAYAYYQEAGPCDDAHFVNNDNNDDGDPESIPFVPPPSPTTTDTEPILYVPPPAPSTWTSTLSSTTSTPVTTPSLPSSPPTPPTPPQRGGWPYRRWRHPFYRTSVMVQIGISVGFLLLGLCITLMCCLSWKVPPVAPDTTADGLALGYDA